MRYAIIDQATNIVQTAIELTDENWTPPEGCILVQNDSVNSGDIYDGSGSFTAVRHVVTADRMKIEILASLERLDLKIPRGMEDLMVVMAVDVSTLPAQTQNILAEKHSLRKQLAACNA